MALYFNFKCAKLSLTVGLGDEIASLNDEVKGQSIVALQVTPVSATALDLVQWTQYCSSAAKYLPGLGSEQSTELVATRHPKLLCTKIFI